MDLTEQKINDNSITGWIARIISFVFHPLFLITYFLLILITINPYIFAIANKQDFGIIIIYIIIISIFFPVIPLFMMYRLGLTKSILLKERKERTIPVALTGIFYLWLYINMLNNSAIPSIFNSFMLGSTITLFACFFVNLFSKISLHTAGISGFVTALFIAQQMVGYEYFSINTMLGNYHMHSILIMVFGLILAGLVGTSRLLLKAHSPQDILGGYMVGFLAQIIAMRIIFY